MKKVLLVCVLGFLCTLVQAFAEEGSFCSKRVLEITMRDGTALPANLFLPKEFVKEKKKVPCILVRQPLGKDRVDASWLAFVNNGYALIVQSTRSWCDTSGKTFPYITDGPSHNGGPSDGYDTVQWVSQQEFCNGSVATIGISATGITQFLLASSAPPNLSCQYIEMAAPSMYQYAVFPGGQLRKEQVEGWLKIHNRDASVFTFIKTENKYDAFWAQFDTLRDNKQLHIPQMHVGGWYDIFLQGTIDAFQRAQEISDPQIKPKHRLIIGPWGHRWKKTGKLGLVPLTEEQKNPPFPISEQTWVDYHVRHVDNGVQESPVVQYYVMGPFDGKSERGNRWCTSSIWPPKGVEYTRYYLGRDRSLAPYLSEDRPKEILFHESKPVPTIGGRALFLPDGPFDLAALLTRDDVVLYSTKPFMKEIEVTGRLFAHLYLSHGNKERDIAVRLVDIYPTGEHYLIAEGYTHMDPQGSHAPEHVVIDLWSTSMVFAKGHQLGILLSASNFPAYDTSLEQGQEKDAYLTLFTSSEYPSSLLLPIRHEE